MILAIVAVQTKEQNAKKSISDRYQEMYSESEEKSWKDALQFYNEVRLTLLKPCGLFDIYSYPEARSVLPSVGSAHNQLAIIATYDNDELRAMYRYTRALSSEVSFIKARENLEILFKKHWKGHEETSIQAPTIPAPGDWETQLSRFFLLTHATLFDATRFVHFPKYSKRTLTLVAGMTQQKKIDSKTLLSLHMVNISAVHSTMSEPSQGSLNYHELAANAAVVSGALDLTMQVFAITTLGALLSEEDQEQGIPNASEYFVRWLVSHPEVLDSSIQGSMIDGMRNMLSSLTTLLQRSEKTLERYTPCQQRPNGSAIEAASSTPEEVESQGFVPFESKEVNLALNEANHALEQGGHVGVEEVSVAMRVGALCKRIRFSDEFRKRWAGEMNALNGNIGMLDRIVEKHRAFEAPVVPVSMVVEDVEDVNLEAASVNSIQPERSQELSIYEREAMDLVDSDEDEIIMYQPSLDMHRRGRITPPETQKSNFIKGFDTENEIVTQEITVSAAPLTENPFVAVSGAAKSNNHMMKPTMAKGPSTDADDSFRSRRNLRIARSEQLCDAEIEAYVGKNIGGYQNPTAIKDPFSTQPNVVNFSMPSGFPTTQTPTFPMMPQSFATMQPGFSGIGFGGFAAQPMESSQPFARGVGTLNPSQIISQPQIVYSQNQHHHTQDVSEPDVFQPARRDTSERDEAMAELKRRAMARNAVNQQEASLMQPTQPEFQTSNPFHTRTPQGWA